MARTIEGLSGYIGARLVEDISNISVITHDNEKEECYFKLLHMKNLMMRNGANQIQYPLIRNNLEGAIRDLIKIYREIGDLLSLHSMQALVCIFTATFSMLLRYQHRLDIQNRITDVFSEITRNLNWNIIYEYRCDCHRSITILEHEL